jgi:hypothetical protein
MRPHLRIVLIQLRRGLNSQACGRSIGAWERKTIDRKMLRHDNRSMPRNMRNHGQNRTTQLRRHGPELLDREVCRITARMMMTKRETLNGWVFCLAAGNLVLAMSLVHSC